MIILTFVTTELIWNSFITTGNEQLIPFKANINKLNNPTHRLAPYTYEEISTITVTY
jgi:hypothetical protein